jgi:lipopolysaccharide/colanic/teichoic acid biosynthesis glycosyltransferase
MHRLVKALIDRSLAFVGLLLLSPVLATALLAVWRQDGRSPLYIADRAGRGGRRFRMVKIRSMIVRPHPGASSTSADDERITAVGHFIRRWKIDELSQLWNVLKGDMSLVGPRPQVLAEVATYTPEELGLLSVKPGITDFSSIVFSDEGEILSGATDPDLAYRRLIRPWKSQLGLFYIANSNFPLDMQLILLTVVRIVRPRLALTGVCRLLRRQGAPEDLIRVAGRTTPLVPCAVPGKSEPFVQ